MSCAKDLTIELTMVAYGYRQNAIEFAQATNTDLLRALKPVMETKFYLSLISEMCLFNYTCYR